MKYLVIGSKGFIGSNLVNYLTELGCEVFGADLLFCSGAKNYFQVSHNGGDFQTVFSRIQYDYCINCSGAASVSNSFGNSLRDFQLNVVNVYQILESIKRYQKNCKFVNLSSAAVYGNPEFLPITEKHRISPISPYGWHKYQSEKVLLEFYDCHSIETISLRIFSAYGPGLQKQLLWDIIQKAKNNGLIVLSGSGNESRDFINVLDVCKAIFLVCDKAKFEGKSMNVANGVEVRISDIAKLVVEGLGFSVELNFNNNNREGDPINWVADIQALSGLGYAQSVNLQEGVKKYVEWTRSLE